jgi:hypothetical protein
LLSSAKDNEDETGLNALVINVDLAPIELTNEEELNHTEAKLEQLNAPKKHDAIEDPRPSLAKPKISEDWRTWSLD